MEGIELKTAEPKGLAVAITVSAPINERRSIVMQTYVDQDADLPVFHALADKLMTVVDRQEWRYQLRDAHLRLQHDENMLKTQESEHVRLKELAEEKWQATGRKGAKQDTTAEQNRETSIRAIRDRISGWKKDIADLEAKIGPT